MKRIPLFRRGLIYALYFMLIAAVMGAVYGLISGVILQPALFSVAMVGVFVSVNAVIALLLALPMLGFRIFGRKMVAGERYLTFSLAFLVVFLPYFAVLKVLPFAVF
ncbi:MAG: hypothetical protein AAF399_29730 [Bacteroidota bacterium]